MAIPDNLPPFTSEKPCPRCHELLHWSDVKRPEVDFNTHTGHDMRPTLDKTFGKSHYQWNTKVVWRSQLGMFFTPHFLRYRREKHDYH